jgi:hypothetical protein
MITNSLTRLTASIALLVPAVLLVGACSSAAPRSVSDAPTSAPSASQQAIQSEEDGQRIVYDCMAERGWTAAANGGYNAPQEQSDKLVEDLTDCSEQVDAAVAPWNESDWQLVYDENIASAQCLQDNGYVVPEEPSLQVFRDTYYTDAIWDPYENVPEDEISKVIGALCPQPELVF